MKSFIKERWLSLVIAVVIVALTAAVVIFIMAMLGFRITYAPELENDWEAISAVASWLGAFISCVGVLASFLAIWYAIQVPKTIADRQDKIALFEKRYECYTLIQKLLVSARQMEGEQTVLGVQVAFRINLDDADALLKNKDAMILGIELKQMQAIIVSGEFLFPYYNTKLLKKIIDVGVELIIKLSVHNIDQNDEQLTEEEDDLKQQFCKLCKEFDRDYSKQLKEVLQLNE